MATPLAPLTNLPAAVELPQAPIAVLDPGALSATAEAALAELLRQGESEHTRRAYRAGLRYWAAWYALRYGAPFAFPLPLPVVEQFVLDHALRENKENELVCELPEVVDAALIAAGFKAKPGAPSLATLEQRLAVLASAHRLQGLDNPCQQPQLRTLLGAIRRGYAKRGVRQAAKPALTRDPLEALLATCDQSLMGLRDRALLLFAWASGGRRRSEVVEATMEGLTPTGPGAYVYTLARSKTNATGTVHPEDQKPVVGAAGEALQAWLAASGVKTGAIFRGLYRGNTVGRALNPAAVRQIVLRRCRLAGIDIPYSAHSLRSGFITEAGRQNVPLGDAMALSGHASVAVAMRYFRSGAVTNERVADLFDRGKKEATK